VNVLLKKFPPNWLVLLEWKEGPLHKC
jgi:hypothetical protein